MRKKRFILFFVLGVLIVFTITYLFINKIQIIKFGTDNPNANSVNSSLLSPSKSVNLTAIVNTTTETKLSSDIDLNKLPDSIPDFIKITASGMEIIPSKYSQGSYKLDFTNLDGTITRYTITVGLNPINTTQIRADVSQILGDTASNYGIYFYDLLRKEEFQINANQIFEPASMAKIGVASLVMRDIDAGKYTLQTTYAIKAKDKFSTIGDIGNQPDGTPITIQKYLEALLIQSDNNAWYALTDFLGGSYEVVNQRIINELGVNPLFLDPPQGTASNLGTVFKKLYYAQSMSRKSSDYIISLLEHAVPSMRAGLGLGVPSDVTFANKIGTLSAGDKVAYEDSAIIYGKNTDYVLIVMDQNTDWATGEAMLKTISQKLYSEVDL